MNAPYFAADDLLIKCKYTACKVLAFLHKQLDFTPLRDFQLMLLQSRKQYQRSK